MNKETLEAIRKEAEKYSKDLYPDPEFESDYWNSMKEDAVDNYTSGAQSKAARDYWIRWTFEKAKEGAPKKYTDTLTVFLHTYESSADLIALADKEDR